MKKLTVILVSDLTDKCDLYIYNSNYSKNDLMLIESLMKKTIAKAESSSSDLSLRSTFSDMLDGTPLAYGLKYRSLPKDIKLSLFTDNANVDQVMVCDFATCLDEDNSVPVWPALHCIYDDNIYVNNTLFHIIADAISNGSHHTICEHNLLYSLTSSSVSVNKQPSFGSIDKFKKIADDECRRVKDAVYVKQYSPDGSGCIVYAATAYAQNNVESNSCIEQFKTQSDPNYEVFRSNHFELRVDDNDYLRLACAKVNVQRFESCCKVLASFHLTRQTKSLLESSLYKPDTEHYVDLKLYSPDSSTVVTCGSAMMKIKKINFSCNCQSDSAPLLIDVLFTT